jgi:gliding motility-associated-like protein
VGIDTLPVALGAIPFLQTYIDSNVDVNANAWYYQVVARDTCGFTLASAPVRTIFLTAALEGGFNELDWNNYQQENAFLLNTTVLRSQTTTLVPIETLQPSVLEYQDPVETAITTDGTFCYVIQTEYQLVIPSMGIARGLETFSQVACVNLPPKIFIPNAFVPDGNTNKTFKPVLLFPAKEYSFQIFDRWGKQLFSTNNIIAGWTGSFNGERLPFGGYVYIVRAVSQAGEVVEEKGVVVLVR